MKLDRSSESSCLDSQLQSGKTNYFYILLLEPMNVECLRMSDLPKRCMEGMQGDTCVCSAHLDDKKRVVAHRQPQAPTGPANRVHASMVKTNL